MPPRTSKEAKKDDEELPSARVPRGHKALNSIPVANNHVVDYPVLNANPPVPPQRESAVMRYTAVTCSPDSFKEEGYCLRQAFYDPPRRTELFIVLRIWGNENVRMFRRSMTRVAQNVQEFERHVRSRTWGEGSWKRIVLCLVAHDRVRSNAGLLSYLSALGVYRAGIEKEHLFKKLVTAHIYEYSAKLPLSSSADDESVQPVQTILFFPSRNTGAKSFMERERWLYKALCPSLQPNVITSFDAGTEAGDRSFYWLWKEMDVYSNVGGVCARLASYNAEWYRKVLGKLSDIAPSTRLYGTLVYHFYPRVGITAYRYICLSSSGVLERYLSLSDLDISNCGTPIGKTRRTCIDQVLLGLLLADSHCQWTVKHVRSATAFYSK